ncbi:uncharacterized protein LOC114784719 [Denticeps clupeoides]|uniref:uncharacterized protein LOC114784719 n=1 Tax=Denticeps clupeoides TaxID=299321 RepID=UPI0010A321E6|nr:uncharacterized protein LOC114784719 [Denticeps clupeoides]XP_028826170.1 uncharacterized protein LOC114784719 [Denticeps clupeoides]
MWALSSTHPLCDASCGMLSLHPQLVSSGDVQPLLLHVPPGPSDNYLLHPNVVPSGHIHPLPAHVPGASVGALLDHPLSPFWVRWDKQALFLPVPAGSSCLPGGSVALRPSGGGPRPMHGPPCLPATGEPSTMASPPTLPSGGVPRLITSCNPLSLQSALIRFCPPRTLVKLRRKVSAGFVNPSLQRPKPSVTASLTPDGDSPAATILSTSLYHAFQCLRFSQMKNGDRVKDGKL